MPHRTAPRVRSAAALALVVALGLASATPSRAGTSTARGRDVFARTNTSIVAREPGAQYLDSTGSKLLVYGLAPSTPPAAGDAVALSHDGGRTFTRQVTGPAYGGGDMDIARGPDGSLMLVDLNESLSGLIACTSSDDGRTWTSPIAGSCTAGVPAIRGAVPDRPWIVSDGRVGGYWVLYADLALYQSILVHTSDNGRTFTPCVPAPITSAPFNQTSSQLGGLYASRPVVDGRGAVRWTIEVYPAQPEAYTQGATQNANSVYAITYSGSCSAGTWSAKKVYADSAAQMRGAVTAMARDAAGTLYAVFSGKISATSPTGAWLFTGPHDGRTWLAPKLVSPAGRQVSRPTVSALGAGRVVVGYYSSANSQNLLDDPSAVWRYFVGVSRDAGAHVATFDASGPLFATGDPSADRARKILADAATVLINPRTGLVTAVYNRASADDTPTTFPPSPGLITVARQQTGVSLR